MEQAKIEEKKDADQARAKKIMNEGGEVNVLDAEIRDLASPEIGKFIALMSFK